MNTQQKIKDHAKKITTAIGEDGNNFGEIMLALSLATASVCRTAHELGLYPSPRTIAEILAASVDRALLMMEEQNGNK